MTQGMAALADAWLPPMVAPHRRGDSALMAPLQAMVERMTPDIFSRQIHALLNRPDAATHLGGIGCPTLVMVGRQDEWSPPAQHEEIAALIPHANLHIIEDAGHMLPCEQPATVAQELRRFVQAILNTAG
jgi:pimeloyl-ACP methyl ester carboxylesterase